MDLHKGSMDAIGVTQPDKAKLTSNNPQALFDCHNKINNSISIILMHLYRKPAPWLLLQKSIFLNAHISL